MLLDRVNEPITIEMIQNQKWTCLESKDELIFRGEDLYDHLHVAPGIHIRICKDHDYCKSKEDILNFAQELYLSVVVKA